VTASSDARATVYDVVSRTADQVFIPLTVGGGVRSADDVDKLLRAGADKVGVNTAAVARPELIAEIADRFGSQVLVLSVDARRCPEGVATDSGYEVTTHGGRRSTGLDAVAWAARAAELGVGEILLNSIDADGMKQGFDLEMLAAVRAAVSVPADRQRRRGRGGGLPAGGRRRRRRGPGRLGVPLRRGDDRPGEGRAAGFGVRGAVGTCDISRRRPPRNQPGRPSVCENCYEHLL